MAKRRRLIALLTTLAVAWTALWPLVSSARVLLGSEATPLCHQAGMQVDPGEMPAQGNSMPLHHGVLRRFLGAGFGSPLEFSVGSVSLEAGARRSADVAIHLPRPRRALNRGAAISRV
jgi:hypothetical protein